MMIEIDTDEVYCSECKKHWNVWESTYYCSCGQTFQAKEVVDALRDVLVFCQVCAEEIERQNAAREIRGTTAKTSFTKFILGIFDEMGYLLGIAVETAVSAALTFLFGRK